MSGYRLRAGDAGPVIKGDTGDVLIYSAEDKMWFPGPQSGGTELPDGTAVDQVLTWNPDALPEAAYQPKGRIATYVIATLAALEAAFPAVDGVHTITEGVVEFQVDLDLDGSRLAVTGPGVVLKGWGDRQTTITSINSDGTVIVTGANVQMANLHLRNTANGYAGQALVVDVPVAAGVQQECVLVDCALGTIVQDDPWSLPANVLDGRLRLINCTVGDSYVKIGGDGASFEMLGGQFVVNNTNDFAVTCIESPDQLILRGVRFVGSRAGIVVMGETAVYNYLEISNCIEGYTGSLLGNAVVAADLENNVTHIIGNQLAGAIAVTPHATCALQIEENTFIGHQNERTTPFVGFGATSPGVCARNNWDSDTSAYTAETPTINASYAFSSLEDLEAAFPVAGGIHTLDQLATYTIMGAGFDLDGGRIQLHSGVLRGQFRETVLSSSVADSVVEIVNDAGAVVENLTIDNAGLAGSAIELTVAATVQNCDLTANVLSTRTVIMPRGRLINCGITTNGSTCGVSLPDTPSEFREIIECQFGQGGGDMVQILGDGTLRMVGCKQNGAWTNWLHVVNAEPTDTRVYASECFMGSADIVFDSGSQAQYVSISNSAFGTLTCDTSDVAAQGMSVLNNKMATAFSGFAETDARVMARSNFVGVAAIAETPITV